MSRTPRRAGKRERDGFSNPWTRALVLLMALCVSLGALKPAASADLDSGNPSCAIVLGAAPDHAPDTPFDNAMSQHCVHCCHQIGPSVTAPELATPAFMKVAFREIPPRVAAREITPPSRPPRS